jgi:ribonuclease P protein component
VVVQALERGDDQPLIRAGFTATRKIGGAVVRNRAKRRLREAARQLLPLHGRPGRDYVFIARGGTVNRPWSRLLDDMKSALISLAANQTPATRSPAVASR